MHGRLLIYIGLILILIIVKVFPFLNILAYLYMMLPLLISSEEEIGFKNYKRGVLYGSVLLPFIVVFFPKNLCSLWTLNQIGVAVAEEIFFRGYLMSALGNLKTSLLFSFAHLINFPTVNSVLTFFPSLVFGFAYIKSGSIVAPIVLHFSANMIYFSLAEEFPELYHFLQRKLTGS